MSSLDWIVVLVVIISILPFTFYLGYRAGYYECANNARKILHDMITDGESTNEEK